MLIGVIVGGALGFLVGWLYRRGQAVAPDDRLANELRQQLTQRETELAQLRDQLTTATSAQAAAEASRAATEKLINDQREMHEKSLRDAKEAQEQALADLRAAFKALSVDTLRELQPQFIERVTETVAKLQETGKGDLTRREEAIKTLVKPLEEQLKIYQQRLQQTESAQSTTLGEVKKHLETLAQQSQSLSNETLQLRRVLSSNQARGRWGEETLRRVVEAAGMSAHCDFSEQTQAGDSKPDLIVRLPGDRVIIVDAKVPGPGFPQRAGSRRRTQSARSRWPLTRAKLKSTSRLWPTAIIPASSPTRSITWCCSCPRNHCSAPRWKAITISSSGLPASASCWPRRPRSSPCSVPSASVGNSTRRPRTPRRLPKPRRNSTRGCASSPSTSRRFEPAWRKPMPPSMTRPAATNAWCDPAASGC